MNFVKKKTYSGCVGAFCGALNFATEPKIGNLADELGVNEHIASGQIAVDVVDLRKVLHAECNATQHTQQLKYLELAIVGLNQNKNKTKTR